MLRQHYDTMAQFDNVLDEGIEAAPAVMDELVLRLVPGGDDSGALDETSFGKVSYVYSGAALGLKPWKWSGPRPVQSPVQSQCMDGTAYYISLGGAEQTVDLKAGDKTGTLQIGGDFPGRIRVDSFGS